MKILMLGLAFFAGFSHAETMQKDGDRYELVFASTDAAKAHESANAFAREVGDILKSNYPSRVLDPNVNLAVFTKNNQKVFRFVWSCRIVKASVNDADYYFDRRGTLLSGATLAQAKRNVETELAASAKVKAMRNGFKNTRIPDSFIRDSFLGSSSEGYWYVKEFFMVAPK